MIWISALIVGLMLGLLGSGGSILTVPVLVYLVGEPGKAAIAESLGIVTLISLAGAVPFALKRQIDWHSVVFFGLPGMAGALAGAYLSTFVPGTMQLMLFACIMLGAAVFMFRCSDVAACEPHALWQMMANGFLAGALAGLIGVGGGFLIVPALVLLGGLSMYTAIGTSLIIIALNSGTGFLKHIDVLSDAGFTMRWDLIFLFSALGIVGTLIGSRLAASISQTLLRRGFALFLVATALFIAWQTTGTLG